LPREVDWVGYRVITEDNWQDVFVDLALTCESEHYRQFSPFEIFASWLNSLENKPYDPWELYEVAVREGAITAIKSFDPPYPES